MLVDDDRITFVVDENDDTVISADANGVIESSSLFCDVFCSVTNGDLFRSSCSLSFGH